MPDTSISISKHLPPTGFSFQMLVELQLEQPYIGYDVVEYAGPEGVSVKAKCKNSHTYSHMLTHTLLDKDVNKFKHSTDNLQHKALFSRFRKKGVHTAEVAARIEANRKRREEERAAKIEQKKLDAEIRARHKAEIAEIKRKAKEARAAASAIKTKVKVKFTEQPWYQEKLKRLREESKQRREEKARAAEIKKQEQAKWREEARAASKARALAKSQARNKTDTKHGDYTRFEVTYDGYKKLYTHYNATKRKCDPALVIKMQERLEFIKQNATDIEIINGKVYSKNHRMGGRSRNNPHGKFFSRSRNPTTIPSTGTNNSVSQMS